MKHLFEHDKKTAAVILTFARKRGRPRKSRPSRDIGTPELVMKKLLGETTEALDLCMERNLLTTEQHWCGIHLRWLYTLRYGTPGVRAIDPTHLGGAENKLDDPEWRSARELEYHDALNKLTQSGHALCIMNLCIFNERPPFLKLDKTAIARRHKEMSYLIVHLQEGLDILVKHWRKRPANKT